MPERRDRTPQPADSRDPFKFLRGNGTAPPRREKTFEEKMKEIYGKRAPQTSNSGESFPLATIEQLIRSRQQKSGE